MKTIGPMFSLQASGTYANTITYYRRKGVNVARLKVDPAQPNTPNQGDQRLLMGTAQKAVKGTFAESKYVKTYITDEGRVASNQSWNNWITGELTRGIISNVTKYEILVAEYEAHAEKTYFDSEAVNLGMQDQTVEYAGTTTKTATAGFQLFLLGELGITSGFDAAPYTTVDIDTWITGDIDSLVSDLETTA